MNSSGQKAFFILYVPLNPCADVFKGILREVKLATASGHEYVNDSRRTDGFHLLSNRQGTATGSHTQEYLRRFLINVPIT